MVLSRISRVEERKAKRRLAIAFLGSISLLVFLAFFGLRILVGFSLFIDRIRGTSPQTPQQSAILLSPILEQLPEATNAATLRIIGKATPKTTLILFINAIEYKKLPVAESGDFSVDEIPVSEGDVTVSAKVTDGKQTSDLSNIIRTVVDRTPPKLTIDAPADNSTINDGTRAVTVTGLTDEDMKVTINGRIVVVKSDGSFTYRMPINDGDNKLTIIARDGAGNETTAERTVKYIP